MKLAFVAFAAAMMFSTSAQAVVVDYSNLAPLGNGGNVPNGYGSSASATLDYSTLTGFGNTSVFNSNVDFWNGNYSFDDAIYATQNGRILQVKFTAAAGQNLTSLVLNLGGYFNSNRTVEYRLYDGSYNLLQSNASFNILGATGGSALALVLNSPTAIFQMGTDWNAGINQLTYQTTNLSAVPVPGALVLLGTALAGLAGAARRRRRKAA